MTPYQMILVVP